MVGQQFTTVISNCYEVPITFFYTQYTVILLTLRCLSLIKACAKKLGDSASGKFCFAIRICKLRWWQNDERTMLMIQTLKWNKKRIVPQYIVLSQLAWHLWRIVKCKDRLALVVVVNPTCEPFGAELLWKLRWEILYAVHLQSRYVVMRCTKNGEVSRRLKRNCPRSSTTCLPC